MKGAAQILGTGAKFKQVPCQKSCRVNQAYDYIVLLWLLCPANPLIFCFLLFSL